MFNKPLNFCRDVKAEMMFQSEDFFLSVLLTSLQMLYSTCFLYFFLF